MMHLGYRFCEVSRHGVLRVAMCFYHCIGWSSSCFYPHTKTTSYRSLVQVSCFGEIRKSNR